MSIAVRPRTPSRGVSKHPEREAAQATGHWNTAADLLKALGNIPARRVRLQPTPGTATERDLLRANEAANRTAVCELVDRTLVEKAMGFTESDIAGLIVTALNIFVRPQRLGIVLGADGMLRLAPSLVRVPDACFISRQRLPGGKRPRQAVPAIAPDLAIEVLSKGNTKAEIERKLQEYFNAGCRLVWVIDPKRECALSYSSPASYVTLSKSKALDGADVLPGFRLSLASLFDPV